MKKLYAIGIVMLMSSTGAFAAAPDAVSNALAFCCSALAACCEAVLACCG